MHEKLFIQYSEVVFFYQCILPTIFFKKWSRQRGEDKHFSSSRTGLESQPLPTFFNFIVTTENRDTPLLWMKIFDDRISLKPGRVPLRIFSAMWDKKFSMENRDTPPPSLMQENFRYQIFSETQKVFSTKLFSLWNKKSRRKIVILSLPLMRENFPYQNFSNTEGFLHEMFR